MTNYILHILKKDLRQLRTAWIVLLMATAGVTVYGCGDWLAGARIRHNVLLVPIILQLVWLQVAALLMRQDSAVRDDAYWLTRPIPRLQLLCAKALFGLLMVVLPQAVSFAIILVANGYSAVEHWPVVLSGAITAGLVFLLGTMVASITRSHSQYWLTILLTTVGSLMLLDVLGNQEGRRWSGFQAVLVLQALVVAVPALIALLVWQYRHRRAPLARIGFGVVALVLLCFYALTPLSAEHSLFASGTSVDVRFAPDAAPKSLPHRDGFALPLELRGLAPGHRLWSDEAAVRFTPTGSGTLTPNGHQRSTVMEHEGTWYLFVPADRDGVEPWLRGPGSLTASLFLTVVEPTDTVTVSMQSGIVKVHGQRCRTGEEMRFWMIYCSSPADSTELLWASRDAETGAVLDGNRLHSSSRSYGLFLEFLLSPLELRAGASPRKDKPGMLDLKTPVVKGHFRADLKIDHLELRRYLSQH